MIEYMAGIIDSESYFRLRKTDKSKYLGADFCLSMTDKAPIDYIVDNYNATFLTQNRGENRKIIYDARLGKSNLLPLIDDVLPYLNEKYKQAKAISDYMRLTKNMQVEYANEAYSLFLKEKYNSSIRFFSLEYFAGIIDGDGYFSLIRDKRGYISFSMGLEQCFQALPSYLYSIYGGNLHYKKVKEPQHRQTVSWRVGHHKGLEILEMLYPLLKLKKNKAELILNTFKSIDNLNNQMELIKIKAISDLKIL